MNHWVAAFAGDGARLDYERTLLSGEFWVSSRRTPIRRVAAGDRVLLYLPGEGFVAEARAAAPCRAPYGATPRGAAERPGKEPVAGVSLAAIRGFRAPVRYGFPQGRNDALGLRRRALSSGFAALSAEGYRDVISRAAQAPPPAEMGPRGGGGREKGCAGQHASASGRRGVALWTVAEAGTVVLGMRGAERHARQKAREAERTWVAGRPGGR